jgi:restriction system protein
MARRRKSGLDFIASLPWPVGIGLGLLAYLGLRYGVGLYFKYAGGALLQSAGDQALGGIFSPLAWLALVLCWIGAAISFFGSRQRRRLLEVQSGLDSIAAIPWRQFEMLVGEAFRRQGYSVQETGLGGADGGIDLILRKGGRTELVQCKQWQTRQVNVSVVREMWGLVTHHSASGAKIVCSGSFTPDAAKFAAGKPIELVTGETLLALIKSGQAGGQSESMTADSIQPARIESRGCPSCGGSMVVRAARKTGEQFWGCESYPRCRRTLPL